MNSFEIILDAQQSLHYSEEELVPVKMTLAAAKDEGGDPQQVQDWEALYEEVLRTQAKTLGKDHANYIKTMRRLEMLQYKWK
jgi:hypothetical protein